MRGRMKRCILKLIKINPSNFDLMVKEQSKYKGSTGKFQKIGNFEGRKMIMKKSNYNVVQKGIEVNETEETIICLANETTKLIKNGHILRCENMDYEVLNVEDGDNLGIYFSILVRRCIKHAI